MNTTTEPTPNSTPESTPVIPALKECVQRLRPFGAGALTAATWLVMLGLIVAACGAAAAGFALWILTGSTMLMGCGIIGACVFATGAALAFLRCAERAAQGLNQD
ncbi:hypothetical protein BH23VER1_BH23VER1_31130 [soil metagenome]